MLYCMVMAYRLKFDLGRVKNIVGKREETFWVKEKKLVTSIFSFSESYFFRVVKSCDCVVKSKTFSVTYVVVCKCEINLDWFKTLPFGKELVLLYLF